MMLLRGNFKLPLASNVNIVLDSAETEQGSVERRRPSEWLVSKTCMHSLCQTLFMTGSSDFSWKSPESVPLFSCGSTAGESRGSGKGCRTSQGKERLGKQKARECGAQKASGFFAGSGTCRRGQRPRTRPPGFLLG